MKRFLLPTLALLMLTFATWHILRAQTSIKQTEPITPPPSSAFGSTVAGAGLVESKTENIEIGSQLPGLVDTVSVKQGQRVRAGDPLFALDTRHIQAELKVREAALRSAQAQLGRLDAQPRKEEVPPSLARVSEALANLAERQDALNRKEDLFRRNVISEEDVVASRQSYAASQAQLERALAEHELLLAGAWSPDKELSRAAVAQAQAQLEQIQTELARHQVNAPRVLDQNGYPFEFEVLQINTRPGEYVSSASLQAPMLLGVIGERHLRVDIDEHDIPRFEKDAPAVAHLRGQHDRPFKLTFVRIEPFVVPKRSLTGDNTERVDTRVLQVLYALEPDAEVYVGQQMDAFIDLSKAGSDPKPAPAPHKTAP